MPPKKNLRSQNKIHTLFKGQSEGNFQGRGPYYLIPGKNGAQDVLDFEKRRLKPQIATELKNQGTVKGSAKELFESKGVKARKK